MVAGLFEQSRQILRLRIQDVLLHDPKALQKLAKAFELHRIGLVMDPVHAGRGLVFQRFGGRDIGHDHELFDQPMGIQPVRATDVGRSTLLVEDDAELREVEVECASSPPRVEQRIKGAIEGGDDRIHIGGGMLVRQAVLCRLHLFVGQPRR